MNADGEWRTVESALARRITVNTPMIFAGLAVGHRLLQTSADPAGTTPVGTANNYGNGYTAWGTYLTTEENFNGYFWEETESAAYAITEEQAVSNARYGVTGQGLGYQWASTDDRFRADLEPNEPNRFGWMVEIDPYDASAILVKHTALGRFKHEGAAFATAANGAAVIYMGDDQRGATPMDRPEWTAVHPTTGEAFVTLTNRPLTVGGATALVTALAAGAALIRLRNRLAQASFLAQMLRLLHGASSRGLLL